MLAAGEMVFHHAARLETAVRVREDALEGTPVAVAQCATASLAPLPRLVDLPGGRPTMHRSVDAQSAALGVNEAAAAVVVERSLDGAGTQPDPVVLGGVAQEVDETDLQDGGTQLGTSVVPRPGDLDLGRPYHPALLTGHVAHIQEGVVDEVGPRHPVLAVSNERGTDPTGFRNAEHGMVGSAQVLQGLNALPMDVKRRDQHFGTVGETNCDKV